jgi:hypothetical protein
MALTFVNRRWNFGARRICSQCYRHAKFSLWGTCVCPRRWMVCRLVRSRQFDAIHDFRRGHDVFQCQRKRARVGRLGSLHRHRARRHALQGQRGPLVATQETRHRYGRGRDHLESRLAQRRDGAGAGTLRVARQGARCTRTCLFESWKAVRESKPRPADQAQVRRTAPESLTDGRRS